jgi:hypothetical protein
LQLSPVRRSLYRQEQAFLPSNVPNCMTIKTLESVKTPSLMLSRSLLIEFFFNSWGKLLRFQVQKCPGQKFRLCPIFFLEIQQTWD